MIRKPFFGSHGKALAVTWFILTLAALGFIIFREIRYRVDIFDLVEMNLHALAILFAGFAYICEDIWFMTTRIHNSKYTKDGSGAYFFFSRLFTVISFMFFALYLTQKFITK
jgi:hypothetical protein